ncbi:catabolic L-serine/threonine dehydratase [Candidozyma auris]|uniref:L-serine ammonia-lyase n=3 Tax=Candidozyma auris TaxID=498019 RepID=A0A0L0NT77_CANAR|nr:hypothetical protein QG37_05750 [[Candida] auris]PIS57025.1 hypothetical protein CJI97_000048 [[Candida] auris]
MAPPSTVTKLVNISDRFSGPCKFYFKMETEQPSGSFKLRGISKLIEQSVDKAKRKGKKAHVFSSSGGNAGLASAYASRHHQVPCTVVLPITSKQVAIDKLKSYDAEVIIHGAHWGEADEYLKKTVISKAAAEIEAVYCHPFENEMLWDGHGDLVDEIYEQLTEQQVDPARVKGIVLSVGGGGLYNGVVTGLRRNQDLKNVPIMAMETIQTNSFSEAVKANKVVTLHKIETIVTSLAAPAISTTTLEYSKVHPTFVEQVDDLEAVKGSLDYYDRLGALIEPACGATIVTATSRQDLLGKFGDLNKDDIIIFIVCGGSGVSEADIDKYRALVLAANENESHA